MSEQAFDPSRYLTKVGSADYLEVKWRLVWLREVHPDAIIETELLSHTDQTAAFKATISLRDGGSATGHGNESLNDFREFFEKAETKAIGRALAALGFGTQFCSDFDFSGGTSGTKIVDSPIDLGATRGVRTNGVPTQSRSISSVPNGNVNPNRATPKQVAYIVTLGAEQGMDEEAVTADLQQLFGLGLDEIDRKQASTYIERLNSLARNYK